MKPGFKSTEFWLNMIGMVGGMVLTAIGENQWTTVAGAILSSICGASYSIGRSVLKGKEAQGTAQVASAAALSKKS